MKNHEQGFTYPLILCLLILFLLFFSMHIDQLLTEEKIGHESASILQQEYYFLSSIKKMELLLTKGSIPAKGVFNYLDGTLTYKADLPSGNVQKVYFTLILSRTDPVSGIGYFDTRSKKLVKWVEAK